MTGWLTDWLRAETGRLYHSVGFSFDAPLAPWAAGLLVASAGAATLFWCRRGPASGRMRLVLPALRAAAVCLVLFLALGPVLVGRRSDPVERLVLLLFDDSASMSLKGGSGRSPGERLTTAYAASEVELLLAASHGLRSFRFGRGIDRTTGPAELTFSRPETRIRSAVEGALSASAGMPVSAVVVFSDGVEQPSDAGGDAFSPGVPVFTVGVGPEADTPSLALASLAVNRTPFDGAPAAVVARVRASGLGGRTAVVEVVEGDRVLTAKPVTLPETGTTPVRLEYVPSGDRFLDHRVRVRMEGAAADSGTVDPLDPVTGDNARSFVVDNRKRPRRILLFSGRPNWQQKFMKRALEEDPAFEVSSLIRISGPDRTFEFLGSRTSTANPLFEGSRDAAGLAPRWDEAVFLRIGVRESELASGYPVEAEDLFRYDLVIWGDVEREFFSQRHLELTRDFVSRRGGSFLVLGGPRALAQGGYLGSVIEPMLPVVPAGGASPDPEAGFGVKPTIEGTLSGVFELTPDPSVNRSRWAELPELFGANRLAAARPGARVFAEVDAGANLDGQPLFAWQRYGDGIAAVLATGETWAWATATDPDDDVHGRFWRQAARALLQAVPGPVTAAGTDNLVVGQADTLTLTVRDSAYRAREGLALQVRVTDPSGGSRVVAVEESVEAPGVYAVPFASTSPGMHRLEVDALDETGSRVGGWGDAFTVHPDHREAAAGRYDPAYLGRFARETGGAFFELADLERLPEAIPITAGEQEFVDRVPVWHEPLFYAILAVLLTAEWYLRRKEGYA